MKNGLRFTLILFSILLNACGQQGPLFMPIENEHIENSSVESTRQETEIQ